MIQFNYMIRTRFAPSPTGFLHIGGLRTALYSYALAKHSGGEFLLRIEDTDQKRLVEGAVEKIFSLLTIFNINWDGDVIIQSKRAKDGAYRQAAIKLLESGHAFYCNCGARNAKTDGYSQVLRDPCRDKNLTEGAIKLRIPDNQKISFVDYVIGKKITWDSNTIADTVLLKSDGLLATYHLAMAVDDHFSNITHVLRTSEWVSSTPIHILVHEYLGYTLPEIGHPTAILDPDGGKLSKRKGNVSVEEFLAQGYLPEAILNFVMLLGWAPKNNQDLFTLNDFVKDFDPRGFQKSNPVMNLQKLDWLNGHYIREKTDEQLIELLKPFAPDSATDNDIANMLPLVKDRLKKLSEFSELVGFFFERRPVSRDLLTKNYKEHLTSALEVIKEKEFDTDTLNESFKKVIETKGYKTGEFFMDLRIGITGTKFTPPITESLILLGKDETIERIEKILKP